MISSKRQAAHRFSRRIVQSSKFIGYGWIPCVQNLTCVAASFVHLWKIDLSTPRLKSLSERVLSAEENSLAHSMNDIKGRQRYRACRTALRDILSKYLNSSCPSDLAFYKTQYGKPFLKQSISANINFNVAHTGDVGLIAISSQEVGIDVEKRTRHISNIKRLINSRLTMKERESLLARSSNLVPEHLEDPLREKFLLMWTRKEAFLKCSGEGIKRGLKSFEIDRFENDPSVLSVDNSKDKALQWTIANVDVDLDHFGSVVYQSESQLPITYYEYK